MIYKPTLEQEDIQPPLEQEEIQPTFSQEEVLEAFAQEEIATVEEDAGVFKHNLTREERKAIGKKSTGNLFA